MPSGLRPSVPLKITSAISPPRKALADCSPSTQRIASDTFDLPHPLGPTMAVTPGRKLSEVLSANDLKPRTVKFLRYMIFVYNKLNTPFCKVQNHYIKGSVHCRSTTCGEEPRANSADYPILILTTLPATILTPEFCPVATSLSANFRCSVAFQSAATHPLS